MKSSTSTAFVGNPFHGNPGISRSAMRDLLARCQLTLGSHVLDIHSSDDRLPFCMEWLGLEVTSIGIGQLSPEGKLPKSCERSKFDLILIRDTSAWPANLLAPEALSLMRQLTRFLGTNASLCFCLSSSQMNGHTTDCWQQHLLCLGGDVRVDQVSTWSWLTPWARKPQTLFVSMSGSPVDRSSSGDENSVPFQRPSPKQLLATCCEFAKTAGESRHRRAA